MMVESVFVNSGRSCINCSGIWASRHTKDIADASRSAWPPSGRCRPNILMPRWLRSRYPASPKPSRSRSTRT